MDLSDLLTTDPAVGAAALATGGLVGLPTETVYGLAADADNAAAIARVFAVKGRPIDHPLILHVAVGAIGSLADDGWLAGFDDAVDDGSTTERAVPGPDDRQSIGHDGRRQLPNAGSPLAEPRPAERRPAESRRSWFDTLAARYWPGPLTMIVPAGPRVLDIVTGGRTTVAIRVPAHPIGQAVLTAFGSAVVAPSANRFGRVSPTTADHVLADLGTALVEGLDVVVDGGDAAVGLESTIVDIATASVPQVLRHGSISGAEVADALESQVLEPSGPVRASGMHDAHYAPTGHLRLAENRQDALTIAAQAAADQIHLQIIDRSHDPIEAARFLYRDLRRADAPDVDGIVVVLPEASGIGIAVRDRLRRAAIGSGRPNRARSTR